MYCNTFTSNFASLNADSPKANFTPASPKVDVSELRDARLQAEEEVANGGTHNSALYPRTTRDPLGCRIEQIQKAFGSFRII